MIDLITLHPKLIHFPIALLFTALFFEILYLLKKNETIEKVSRWLFGLGLIGSVFGVVSGLIAADQIGHDSPGHDLVHDHRNWMFIATALWAFLFIAFELGRRRKDKFRKLFILGLVPLSIIFAIGTDLGGKLVFEHAVGVNLKSYDHQQDKQSNQRDKDHEHHHDHEH